MSTRARIIWAAVVIVVVGGAFGLYWFQPWKLFTSKTVNEPLPSVGPVEPAPTGLGTPTATATVPQNVVLASGTIISHEHASSGTVRLIRLADGRVQLTLENLDTSDGPDLHVWLTDQPVIPGNGGWFVFDDGRYVELGPLKANQGNQVYDVPAGTDLAGLASVSIWCKRFAVSFGAAPLDPV
jgi:Electron transfer DM13